MTYKQLLILSILLGSLTAVSGMNFLLDKGIARKEAYIAKNAHLLRSKPRKVQKGYKVGYALPNGDYMIDLTKL